MGAGRDRKIGKRQPGAELGPVGLDRAVNRLLGIDLGTRRIGLAIAVLGQISWAQTVRSIAAWLMGQARRIWLIGWAAAFVAVLIYF